MTDEELQKTIQEVSQSIDNLPEPDKPLPKREARRRRVLLLRREALYRIKEAREKGEKSQEFYHSLRYGLLTSLGEKHSFLMRLAMTNFNWHPFD